MTLRTKEQPSDSTHIGTFSHQGEYVLSSRQSIPPNVITVVSILLPKDQRRSDPLLASFLDNLSIPQTRPNINGDFVSTAIMESPKNGNAASYRWALSVSPLSPLCKRFHLPSYERFHSTDLRRNYVLMIRYTHD